jgi:hypothetical protein
VGRRSFRFHPPLVEYGPALRWALLRAFGPVELLESVEPPALLPEDATATVALALRLELAARIAARHPRQRLTAELGEEGAAALARERTAATAMGLQIAEVARDVAEVASVAGLPIAFLKFMALEAAGYLAPGARSACDVDLLVPARAAESFWRALQTAGFSSPGQAGYEHQLPTLIGPRGGAVEIHRMIPGVRLAGRGSATWEDLEKAGLLEPLPPQAGFPGACTIPAAEVLAAHAAVHGLGQHGFWPGSYPLFRMVADLIDLGGSGESDLGALTESAGHWIERDVPPAEVEALRALCRRLAAGETPGAGWDAPEETLLRHLVAGRLDADYEAALRLALFRRQPSDRPAPLRLAGAIASTLWLSRPQIDALYGKPRGPLGYAGRRLARPFDLLGRLAGYGWRALRSGSRG